MVFFSTIMYGKYMNTLKYGVISFLFFAAAVFLPRAAYAITFELIPPSGQLTRGQNIQFTINIDTQGATVKSTQIGMTYDTTVLKYVSTAPGSSMNSVTTTEPTTGQLLLAGANTAGFSGKDVYAVVTFTIIAQAPGSTQLCTLFVPSTTPQPTSPPLTPQPTSAPQPTALPKSGSVSKTVSTTLFGVLFIGGALALLALKRDLIYENHPHNKEKKISKKNRHHS